jgi:hypothetical protein
MPLGSSAPVRGLARKQRDDVKHHEETPHAHISALFSDKGYGF